ncbi:MAG TPA: Mur ligase family protein, partial [Kiloniellaceae bacterium]|nr:Mur ligase family protein [Kiloniellaceae bacterium]
MKLDDVRRLTGPSLLLPGPGAVGDAALPDDRAALAVGVWRKEARRLLDAVGWCDEVTAVRPFEGGASLALSAPLDALYAATDLLEASWQTTLTVLDGKASPDNEATVAALRAAIAAEGNPRLLALAAAAEARGVSFLEGDGAVSLGLGNGVRLWPDDDLPDAAATDFTGCSDIPHVLVSGTNGKSTTVRLAAAIGAAAGKTVGLSSSDWVRVGGEIVAEGDFSGPGGARQALRDPRAELAVLEVARGGLMRRGLALTRADACLITNVAADHLGDYGIKTVEDLTAAKLLLARAVKPGGRLILNADDPRLVAAGMAYGGDIAWFSLQPAGGWLPAWADAGGSACFIADDSFVLAEGGGREVVLPVGDFPAALGGRARHNLANALGAIALAAALRLPPDAMAKGLAGFSGTPQENPGRGNIVDLGGATALIDFAHNPHGLAALLEMASGLEAKRRLVILGQAGDRRDEDIRELVQTLWRWRPDRVIVKEMLSVLRGREAGVVPAIIAAELARLGAPAHAVGQADSELEAVRQALRWAEAGDLLVLLLHAERKAVLALLESLQTRGWSPGEPI